MTSITMTSSMLSTEPGWLSTKETAIQGPLTVTDTSATTEPFPFFDFENKNTIVRCLDDEDSTQFQFQIMDLGEVRVTVSAADYKRLRTKWRNVLKVVDRFPLMNIPIPIEYKNRVFLV